MDIDTLRGLATVFAMAGFLAVVWWACRPSMKARFDEAAALPFSDEDDEVREN